MNVRKSIFDLLGAYLLIAVSSVAAQDATGLSVSGYGTLGFGGDNRDGIGFVRDFSQRVGGESRSSLKADTRIGLQLAYRASNRLEFVSQVVVRQQADATLARSIEWAYMDFRPVPELDVRAGRVGVDVFMLSDYRNLGYAYTWVRPPKEAYGWMPMFSLDGVDATYSINTEGALWRIKGQAGRGGMHAPMLNGRTYDFETRGFWDATLSRESGPWRMKAGHARLEVGTEAPLGDLRAALDGVAALGVPGISVEAASFSRGLLFKGARISYSSIGLAFDDGRWQAQGELSRINADRAIMPQGTAAYASLGRRFGEFMPYLAMSQFRASAQEAAATSDWSLLGADPARLQAGAVRATNSARIDQRTVSLGARWDFHQQMALKLQWDGTAIERNGYGLWSVADTRPLNGDKVRVLTLSLDFVF